MTKIDERELMKILKKVETEVKQTKYSIAKNANREVIKMYHIIGKYLNQNKTFDSNYIKKLSKLLTQEYEGKIDFSKRNLLQMKKFYREYKKVPKEILELPWTHGQILIRHIKDKEERRRYAKEALKNSWSSDILQSEIEKSCKLL